MTEALEAIADRFHPREQITAIRTLGSGNVNETFLVTHEGANKTESFVMQRLNTAVFERPDLVMRNLQALGAHMDRRMATPPPELQGRRWRELCPAETKTPHGLSTTGSFGAQSLTSALQLPATRFRIATKRTSWGMGLACSTT